RLIAGEELSVRSDGLEESHHLRQIFFIARADLDLFRFRRLLPHQWDCRRDVAASKMIGGQLSAVRREDVNGDLGILHDRGQIKRRFAVGVEEREKSVAANKQAYVAMAGQQMEIAKVADASGCAVNEAIHGAA